MPTSPSIASSTLWNDSYHSSAATKCMISCKKSVKELAVSQKVRYFAPNKRQHIVMKFNNAYAYSYYYFTQAR